MAGLVGLLIEARQYLSHGTIPRRLRYCPVCGRRARMPDGATRCAACVAAAIDRLRGGPEASMRPWARDHERCRRCGTREAPHHTQGYCRRCWGVMRRARGEAAA